jgi:TonB family protein
MATLGVASSLVASPAAAQVVAAEPTAPVLPTFPQGAPPVETQVVLQLVVAASGEIESAVVTSHAPPGAPASFDAAAVEAVKRSKFHPSVRDGRPIRSRIEYVVVFRPPPSPDHRAGRPSTDGALLAPAADDASRATSTQRPTPPPLTHAARGVRAARPPLSTDEQDEDYAQLVQVRGIAPPSPRGVADLRISRELLEASPRQQTSEMLSAAPGFFVDHEDGEGLGNDVYLRGFDLEHGSGIEMRVGNIPINNPVHVMGQGYADVNFIIPEVVRSIRVVEGPYDPRQGDAAIVGSAYFDLGVPDRGYRLKTTYGSFNQLRVAGIVAPEGADDETFVAFALRKTDGFGENRASQSATINAQHAVDVGPRDRVRMLATAYGARASLAGVVREDDVDAGRIGLYDSYPFYAGGQGVQAARVVLGVDLDHAAAGGTRFEMAPWLMWTNFRARQNFSGNIYSSQLDPQLPGGIGDLWESTNVETAAGLTARMRPAPWRLGSWLEAAGEPGVYARVGHTDQTKSLLSPTTLQAWDRRLDAGLDTLDVGGYVDLDLRLWRRLHLSGGVRADLLAVTVDDRLGYDVPAGPITPGAALPGEVRAAQGLAVGPRVTAAIDATPEMAPVVSYGEGFRSLDATANVGGAGGIAGEGPSIQEGGTPYSKVRSGEVGFRAQTRAKRYTVTLSVFETWVQNELVPEATSGGFTTEGASLRRGVVGSALASPFEWLLASAALSISSAQFVTLVPGAPSHDVPNVPPVLLRVDVSARHKLAQPFGRPLTGRLGVGYTFLAGRHLTDVVVGPSNNVLNANAALRYGSVEVGIDAFNVLNLRYADDAEYYTSNWSLKPGTALATSATHWVAAPPLTVLGGLSLFL